MDIVDISTDVRYWQDHLLRQIFHRMTDSVDPDQIAPSGSV